MKTSWQRSRAAVRDNTTCSFGYILNSYLIISFFDFKHLEGFVSYLSLNFISAGLKRSYRKKKGRGTPFMNSTAIERTSDRSDVFIF